MKLDDFWEALRSWSEDAFGSDSTRGPSGPLEHLREEVEETIENPHDLMEYADMVHLVFDAARRAGYKYHDLEIACETKLAINKRRKWPAPSSDKPVMHIKEPK